MRPIEAIAMAQSQEVNVPEASFESEVEVFRNMSVEKSGQPPYPSPLLREAIRLMMKADNSIDDLTELKVMVETTVRSGFADGDFAESSGLLNSYDTLITPSFTVARNLKRPITLKPAKLREYKRRREEGDRILAGETALREHLADMGTHPAIAEVYNEGPLIKMMRDGELNNMGAIYSLGKAAELPPVFDTKSKATALAEKGFLPLVESMLSPHGPIDYEALTTEERELAKETVTVLCSAKSLFDYICLNRIIDAKPVKIERISPIDDYEYYEYYRLPTGHPYTRALQKISSHPWTELYGGVDFLLRADKDPSQMYLRKTATRFDSNYSLSASGIIL